MADLIELRGLRLSAIVGILPHEREQPQPLELDIDVVVDLAPAGRSDAIADTVDYGALCDAAEEILAHSSFGLLEALADRVAGAVLAQDQRITDVVVAVRKLRPPVAQQLATSGVRITRSR